MCGRAPSLECGKTVTFVSIAISGIRNAFQLRSPECTTDPPLTESPISLIVNLPNLIILN
jgi:hypothetical protein